MTHLRPFLIGPLAAMLLLPVVTFSADGPAEAVSGQNDGKDETQAATKFLRVVRDETKRPIGLQTAVVRYVPAAGKGDLAVDLVAAVHVGDESYYRQLNERFEDYDVLLYELVAPRGTRIPKGGRNGSTLPTLVKNLLELESQVEKIDYTKKNLVHADLSFKEMGKLMDERGQTGFTLAMSVFSEMLEQQQRAMARQAKDGDGGAPEIGLFTLLFDKDRALKLKRTMAVQFENLDETGGLGDTLNRLLVADRNKAALKILKAEIAKGHKRIAVFYGAAHMPDFEKRLLADFGLKRGEVEWLTAWDLKK